MNKEFLLNIGGDNRDEYHQIMGGKKGYWDKRYCFDPTATKARSLLIKLGIKIGDISDEIGVSPSTISRTARGIAGLKPVEKFDGLSTTEYVVGRLEEMVRIRQTD